MKKSHAITKHLGIIIGAVAIYLSFRNIKWKELYNSLLSMDLMWLVPIVGINFLVIAFKAARWQAMIEPVKKIKFGSVFRVLTIGFMANNIFPARFGEFLRVLLLGRNESVNRTTIAATLLADRIIEGVSFILLSTLLFVLHATPKWLERGVLITIAIIIPLYLFSFALTRERIANTRILRSDNRLSKKLAQLTEGLHALSRPRHIGVAILTSLLSWIAQGLMVYLIQISYGVDLPIWGLILVLIAVNLAIAIPSAPSHIGTFEFACILAYTYIGLDKSMALLLGITYHMLQVVPVTAAGIILAISGHVSWTHARQEEPQALD